MRNFFAASWFACICMAITSTVQADGRQSASAAAVRFAMHRVGTYRGEACGVGDFNNDGRLDIVALPYLYLAPDWKPQQICTVQGEVDQQDKGYRWDFMNVPLDCNGDGLLDVVTCSWHGKRCHWLRNPGTGHTQWPRILVEENGNFECGDLWDIDGDGKAREILPHVLQTVWYEVGLLADGSRGLVKHVVSDRPITYGGGVGDLNGDGRPDIVRPGAWYEAPADPRSGQWKEHPLAVGSIERDKADHTPQIWVYDANADGLADIITSSAHKYGIFWYQQVPAGSQIRWKQHLIDKSWSQAHSLALADLDQDGDLDLVAGKRFMAHNGNDPGAFEPLGLYWYELKRGPRPVWVKHIISYNQGVGSGMNVPVVDLDGDGDLDIVVTGKWGGPVWFENQLQ